MTLSWRSLSMTDPPSFLMKDDVTIGLLKLLFWSSDFGCTHHDHGFDCGSAHGLNEIIKSAFGTIAPSSLTNGAGFI